jgi:N,N-dimethylformamidase
MLTLLGYPDRYSAAPGEKLSFHISLEQGTQFDAELVRVYCGDCNPEGPGVQHEVVPCAVQGRHVGTRQHTDAGSFMRASLPVLAQQRCISFMAMIWPTLPGAGPQTIACIELTSGGQLRLEVDAPGELVLYIGGDGATPALRLQGHHMLERQWYSVGFAVDLDQNRAQLFQRAKTTYPGIADSGEVQTGWPLDTTRLGIGFTLAGAPVGAQRVERHFNGKIDSPALLRGWHGAQRQSDLLHRQALPGTQGLRLAQWDFSQEIPTRRAVDLSDHGHHGELHQAPARAMKGWNWSGRCHDWTLCPEEYGAIHFHEDDLYDAQWTPSLEVELPSDLPSGAYALRISQGPNSPLLTREAFIPFFVRPPVRPAHLAGRRDRIAFLAPSVSYVAYANHRAHIDGQEVERNMGHLLEFGHADVLLHDQPQLGGSLYDKHRDGSGRCHSSRLRPVLNFSSRYHSWLGGHGSALWQYNADTHLLAWLRAKGFDHDVITDEDLHHEGSALLADYRVLITGTHPEYYSSAMHGALRRWQAQGGRLMYLGGNGFYWHVAMPEAWPGLVEVRRAEDGIRTWESEPGEYRHAATGELSGLFRRTGTPPNEVCGVGFVAQGFDLCSYYRRAPDADNPRAAFIFDGVPDDRIGDFGLIGGGAAGLEIDAMNSRLGTPPHALRLASSENHTQQVLLANEEFGVVPHNISGDQNDRIRADLVFYETSSGGAVFSVGSIAWCGSLPVNGFDNNVSRITENVLRRFAHEEAFKP